MNKVEKTLDTDMVYSTCIEDQELDTITYRLSPINRWHPKPERIVGYKASLVFGTGKYNLPIDLLIQDIDQLKEFIDFLTELKTKWEEANSTLSPKEIK